jgi:glycosyltransferase involved in cell wall biosynthesis
MRLCVVSGTFHPEPGGPPTYLYHLLPELRARGHALRVVTYGDDLLTAPGAYPYPVIRISRRQPIAVRLAAMTRTVLAQAGQADCLFVSDYGLPPALANLALRRPLVLKNVGDFAWEFSTRHGWIPAGQATDEFQTAPHSSRVRLLRWVQAAYTRSATRLIAPSRYSAGLMQGWGVPPERVRVIYNALDCKPFEALPPKAEARARLGLPAGVPLCVCVARLAPWKNVGALIRAWPEVRQQANDATCVIVGDGPYWPEWKAQAAGAGLGDSFRFVGAQPPEQTRLYLRAADAFVLYSRYEGLPHVVLEAMAAGTPVIVSDAGGNLEVVEHERTGVVAPLADEAGLAASISRVLTDTSLASNLAQAAMASLARFDWPQLVEQTEAVLLEAVEAARR